MFPVTNDEFFLYDRIAEHVEAAEVLDDSPGTDVGTPLHVVSVKYAPPPHPDVGYSASPVCFWIDPRSRMVMRQTGEFTSAFRPGHLVDKCRVALSFSGIEINQPVPESMFEFVPPGGFESVSLPRGRRLHIGGGSSFRDPRGVECRRSHEWDGGIFVDREDWVFKGHAVEIEKKRELAEDGTQLSITERIKGPKTAVEQLHTLGLQ